MCGENVKLGDYSKIRTGLVLSRKEATNKSESHQYTALTLKAVTDKGGVDMEAVEPYNAAEPLKQDYLTHTGDVLLRLSAPYTVALIPERNEGLLISSHFAIIRANHRKLDPYYLHWWLTQNKKIFYRQASGASMMGTISSGYVSDMEFNPPPLETQRRIATLLQLSYREQELLRQLSAKKTVLVNASIKQIINRAGGKEK
jgi:restriction endonuclease S subunit